MAEAVPNEKLRQYLRELTPEARALLATGLERALARGDNPPGASLILNELRGGARDTTRKMPPRLGNPQRLFFAPIDPFLRGYASINGTTGAYTAGSTANTTDVVKVTDGLGNSATASVSVGGGLTLSPSSASVAPRGSRSFTGRLVRRASKPAVAATHDALLSLPPNAPPMRRTITVTWL